MILSRNFTIWISPKWRIRVFFLFRDRLKKIFPEKSWLFFRWIDKYIIHGMYGYLAIRFFSVRIRLNRFRVCSQSIPTFYSKIGFDPSNISDITTILADNDVDYKSGRHSAYLFGNCELSKINDDIIGRYPEPFGLKVIKSRELSNDGTPYYTSAVLAPASTKWSMNAIGSVLEKSIVANLLNQEDVAPRVYDIIKLKSGNGVVHYGLIVQHIEGPVVHGDEGVEFVKKFKKVLSSKGMSTASIAEHCDLRAPLFRDNIVRDAGRAYYVDIQNFILSDIGKTRKMRDMIVLRYRNDLLSNLVLSERGAGKKNRDRNLDRFASMLAALINNSGFFLEKCVVLDTCSGVGTALVGLLTKELFWGDLIRPEQDCSMLKSWWYVSGYTRFDCFGSENYQYDSIIGKGDQFSQFTKGLICDTYSESFEKIAGSLNCEFVVVLWWDEVATRVKEVLNALGYSKAAKETFSTRLNFFVAEVYTRKKPCHIDLD